MLAEISSCKACLLILSEDLQRIGVKKMLGYFSRNKKLIHYLITALFLFGFAYIPPMAPLTPTGMGMVGVFIGAVYGWTTLNMLWPSMMALVAMGLHIGMMPVLGASFGNPVVLMMLIMLPVMGLLNETHTTETIAVAFVTNKLTLGRPWVLIGLFFLGAFAGSLINPIVTLMLFMGFIAQICRSVDIPLKSPFTAVMAIGIAIAALLGQTTIPFYNAGLSYTATYAAMFQVPIPYAKWFFFFLFIGILLCIISTLIARFVFRLDVSRLKDLDPALFGEKKPWTTEQKISIGAFVAFILLVILGSFLPPTNIVGAFLAKLTIFGQIALVAGVLMLLIRPDGEVLFNFGRMAATGISWDVVFMVALIMPLAQFLTAENTGVTPFLAMLLRPLMALPPLGFIILALVVGALLTNFANNFVIAIIIMPVIYSFSMQTGMAPLGPIMVLFVCTQMAVGTPGASFPVAICYSFSEIVDAPMMMKYAWLSVVIMIIICLAVALPIALLLF